MLQTATLERARFSIDGYIDPVEGYTYGDRWNGWAVPYFDRDGAEAIAAQLRKHGVPVAFDAERNAYVLGPSDDLPEAEVIDGFTPDPQQNPHLAGVMLWGIGAYGWTWEREPDA